jgi:hypothetical protein
VAEVNVDPGRVDAILHAQGLSLADGSLKLLPKLVFRNNLIDPAAECSKLFIEVDHLSPRPPDRVQLDHTRLVPV